MANNNRKVVGSSDLDSVKSHWVSLVPDKQGQCKHLFLLLVLTLGLIFFVRNVHFQFASDDLAWLKGEAPTVFDLYRIIPRLFFVLLDFFFGPDPHVALIMIFLVHSLDTFLIYHLCLRLLKSTIAANASALIFMINPITLTALTWFSCFSYVLGTLFALLSFYTFFKSNESRRPLPWLLTALLCYGLGLCSSHELFFLPFLFLFWGWFWGNSSFRRGIILFIIAMLVALLVNLFVYDFGRYSVRTNQVFSIGFLAAFSSTAISLGMILGIAYPLSFFTKTIEFMTFCFTEPVRWGLTLIVIIISVIRIKSDRIWKLWILMTLSFMSLITPYLIRLFLTPESVNYHISYMLSGRVFYLPFTILALSIGGIIGRLYEHPLMKEKKLRMLLPFLAVAAYMHALLLLYTPADFMGLSVMHGSSQILPPPWNPYIHDHLEWFLGSFLVITVIVAGRLLVLLKKSNAIKDTCTAMVKDR